MPWNLTFTDAHTRPVRDRGTRSRSELLFLRIPRTPFVSRVAVVPSLRLKRGRVAPTPFGNRRVFDHGCICLAVDQRNARAPFQIGHKGLSKARPSDCSKVLCTPGERPVVPGHGPYRQ